MQLEYVRAVLHAAACKRLWEKSVAVVASLVNESMYTGRFKRTNTVLQKRGSVSGRLPSTEFEACMSAGAG